MSPCSGRLEETIRALTSFLRIAVFFLPLLLLALWGLNYLSEGFEVLSAPGSRVEFAYKAKAGILHVSAESYNLALSDGMLRVVRPSVRNAEGELVAAADSGLINGIALFGETRGPLNIVVRDLTARIVRLPDGTFEINQYLPEEEPSREERPFSAVIEGFDALYVDRSGRGTFMRRVTSERLYAEGSGERWVAFGTADVQGMGRAQISVQRLPDIGLLITGETAGMEVAEALAHFKTIPEGRDIEFLKGVQASSVFVQGPVRVLLPAEGDVTAELSLHGEARDVDVKDLGTYDRGVFDGLITDDGARGTLVLERRGSSARMVGSVTWSGGLKMAGALRATATNPGALPAPVRSAMPDGLSFTGGAAAGWMAYEADRGVSFDGTASAQTLTFENQTVRGFEGKVSASPRLLRLEEGTGLWGGAPLRAWVAYLPESEGIRGLVEGDDVPLSALPVEVGGVSGRADVQALLAGTVARPEAFFRAEGEGSMRIRDDGAPIGGQFLGAGQYSQGRFAITSMRLEGEAGRMLVGGEVSPQGGLDLRIVGENIDLAVVSDELVGRGSVVATVGGTLQDPTAAARVQAAGMEIAGREVPLVVGDLTLVGRTLTATRAQAISGAGRAEGRIAYNLDTGGLSGELDVIGLRLSSIQEGLRGRVDVRDATIAGTLQNPQVSGTANASVLLPAGIRLRDLVANFALVGDEAEVSTFSGQVAGGIVQGSARYDIGDGRGVAHVQALDIDLSELAPDLAVTASVTGTLSGEATASFQNGQLASGRSSGTMSDVVLNQTLIGSGPWSVTADPATVTADVQLGTLERYVQFENLSFDRQAETLDGTLTAYQIPLQDIHTAVRRYLPEPGSDIERRLRRIEGIVDASVALSGPARSPDVSVELLEATQLVLEGRELGTLAASMERAGEAWRIERVDWDSESGTLRASGVVDESGPIRVEGNLYNLDLALLSLLTDRMARLAGRASVQFAVLGSTASPEVTASLDASRVVTVGEEQRVEYGLVLDTVHLSESRMEGGVLVGGLEAEGRVFYRGVEGLITAHAPLRFPFEIPRDQPIDASVTLVPRQLDQLSEYFPNLDLERTEGSVSGRIAASGLAGQPVVTGRLRIDAPTFALQQFRTHLTGASAEAVLDEGLLSLNMNGASSRGGSASLNVNLNVGDVMERIDELVSTGIDPLLDRTVGGFATFDQFQVRDAILDDGRLVTNATGRFDVSGTLRSPFVQGQAHVVDTSLTVPTFEDTEVPIRTFVIDPRFNLRVTLDETARLSTGLANLDVVGSASLDGSMSAMDAAADLNVQDGSVQLPTARVGIEPGGFVRLRYNVSEIGDANANLFVNLEGRTAVTESRMGEFPQRYDIVVRINGDMFAPEGPLISAESDPPGLSRDRILMLLGEADLIAGLVGGLARMEVQERLRETLTGFAVPALLAPITSSLARGLGFEFLTLEFDAFNRITLSFSRPVGSYLVLHGRRQVSPPLPGMEPEFDIRLTYRLPFRQRVLNRTSVSLGFDQDTPWKILVEYGLRF